MKNTAKIWVVGRCLVAVVQLARKVVQLTGGLIEDMPSPAVDGEL